MSDDEWAEVKRRVFEWHKACVAWAVFVGEGLPEWALGVSGREATPEDCARLNRETDVRVLWGRPVVRDVPLRGLMDFIRDAR